MDIVSLKAFDDLIERSLKASPDLKAAQAALLVARENVLAQRGAYYPSVTGGFSATRAKTSSDISPVTNTSALNYSLYTPQLSVSFVPDVFGLNRRTVESLKAQEQQARFALAATHITLSTNVAAAAIQEASLAGADCSNASTDRNQHQHASDIAHPVREGLCWQARCGCTGITARASYRHFAAAA